MTVTVVNRRPVLRVWVDGREVTNRVAARASYGLDLVVAEATVTVPTIPTWAVKYNPTTGKGSVVKIDMGPTAAECKTRFVGFFTSIGRGLYPRSATMLCKGLLERARSYQCSTEGGVDMINGGVGVTDEAQTAAALDLCNLTVAEVLALGGSRDATFGGTGKILGTWVDALNNGFTIREGETVLSYLSRLDKVCLGWRLFETVGGRIVRGFNNANPISTFPTTTAAYTFTEGTDIFAADMTEDGMERRNRVVVTGYGDPPPYQVVQEAGAVSYITEPVDSDLIEKDLDTDPGDGLSAKAVGDWIYREVNRTDVKVQGFRTPRGELFGPGQTHHIHGAGDTSDRLALNQNLWCQHVDCEILKGGKFQQTLVYKSGRGDTPDSDLPPAAAFTMTLDRELIVSGTSEIVLYTVTGIASSLGLSGTISSYAWTATGGTPSSGTGEKFSTSYTDIAGKSISLTVTDSNAATGTATMDVPPATDTRWVRRPLYLASKGKMDCFDGTSWWTQSPASDNLVVSNGPVWGAGDRVYRSTDYLETAPSYSVPSSGNNVTALYVETDLSADKVLAGCADGSVWLSLDAGATWTSLGSPEASAILKVIINPYSTSQYFALTAAGYYDTVDGGASWSNRNPAPAGVTWYDVAHSWDRAYLVVGDDGAGNPYAEDSTATAQTFPGGAAGLYAVTARIDGGYACYDSAKATYLSPSGSATFAAGTALPAAVVVQPRGLWRDGAIGDLFYIAGGTAGAWKSIDGFGSAGGYYQVRKASVGNAAAALDVRQIGADGLLGVRSTALAPYSVWESIGTVGYNPGQYLLHTDGPGGHIADDPANWYLPTFDHSAWSYQKDTATWYDDGRIISGVTAVYKDDPQSPTRYLNIHPLPAITGVVDRARIYYGACGSMQIWLNGTEIRAMGLATTWPGSSGPPHAQILEIDPALFVEGDNTLCLIVAAGTVGGVNYGGSWWQGASWKLEVNY